MKTKTFILILASSVLAGTGVIRADDKADLDRSVAALDAAGKTPADHARVLERISKDTGVPTATLEQQKTSSGLGYGELLIANSLAKSTGKTFEELLAERQAGRGWGEIAKANDVKLGRIVRTAKKSEKALAKETDHSSKRPVDRGSRAEREARYKRLDHPLPSEVGERGSGGPGRSPGNSGRIGGSGGAGGGHGRGGSKK